MQLRSLAASAAATAKKDREKETELTVIYILNKFYIILESLRNVSQTVLPLHTKRPTERLCEHLKMKCCFVSAASRQEVNFSNSVVDYSNYAP